MTTYRLRYGPEHPPPGHQPDERIDVSLNRFRRIILTKIPTRAIGAITFNRDESSLITGDIVSRLNGILVNEEIEGNELYIRVTAPADRSYTVTTDDIVDSKGNSAPVVGGIQITHLRPGKTFDVILHVEVSTSERRLNPGFSPVSAVWFHPGKELGTYFFSIALVEGFTDIEGLLEIASKLAELPENQKALAGPFSRNVVPFADNALGPPDEAFGLDLSELSNLLA